MKASESWPERRRWEGFDAMAGLFFPRSWPVRLLGLAGILLAVAFEVPDPFDQILLVLVIVAYTAGGGIAIIAETDKTDDDERAALIMMGLCYGAIACAYAVWVVAAFLVSLAGNGSHFATAYYDPFAGEVGWAELLLVLVTLWLLIGVPNQAYKLKLGKDGTAQHVLVGVITAAACVLTGTYLFLQQFAGGPLTSVKRGPLVAGTVFTSVLVWPFYRSLARACWQRGLGGVLNPKALKGPWRETVTEVRSAKRQAAEDPGWADRTLRALYTYQRRGTAAQETAWISRN
jgi:hypothetical protein